MVPVIDMNVGKLFFTMYDKKAPITLEWLQPFYVLYRGNIVLYIDSRKHDNMSASLLFY